MTVEGSCHPSYEPLRDLLAARLADGSEAGASVAVVHDGELVVDLWGGEARPGVPWARGHDRPGLVGDQDDGRRSPCSCWSTGASSTWTRRWRLLAGVRPARRPRAAPARPHLRSGRAGPRPSTSPASSTSSGPSGCWPRRSRGRSPGTASGYHMVCHGHLLDGLVRGGHRDAAGRPVPHAGGRAARRRLPPRRARGRAGPVRRPDPPAARRARPLAAARGQPAGADDRRTRCSTSAASATPLSGGGCRWPAPTATATPARSPGPSRWSRTAARWAAYDCCRGRPSTGSSRSRPTGPTWSCWCRCAGASATDCPQPTSAPAVPDGRVCWWTGYGGAIVVNDLDRRTTVPTR